MPQVGSYSVRIRPGLASKSSSSGSSTGAVARCTTSRGVMEVFGTLIDLSPEATDQMLVEVAHHAVRHHVRMQVDRREVLANLEQHPSLVEPDDGIGEIELLEDDPRVVGEVRDVVLKVLAGLGAPNVASSYSDVL